MSWLNYSSIPSVIIRVVVCFSKLFSKWILTNFCEEKKGNIMPTHHRKNYPCGKMFWNKGHGLIKLFIKIEQKHTSSNSN